MNKYKTNDPSQNFIIINSYLTNPGAKKRQASAPRGGRNSSSNMASTTPGSAGLSVGKVTNSNI